MQINLKGMPVDVLDRPSLEMFAGNREHALSISEPRRSVVRKLKERGPEWLRENRDTLDFHLLMESL